MPFDTLEITRREGEFVSDEDRKRLLITPPPGLLPPVPAPPAESEAVNTGSSTRRIAAPSLPPETKSVPVPVPTFFPTVPGLPAPATPSDSETGTWTLRLPDGARHPVPQAGIVVGRNPTPPRAWPDATPLAVDDSDKTVSKSHAVVVPVEGVLTVIDLKSTNGTAVIDAAGTHTVDGARDVDHDVTAVLGSFRIELSRG